MHFNIIMKKLRLNNNYSRLLPIIFLVIVVLPLSIVFNADIISRALGTHLSNQYNDLNHYINLADKFKCWAFYPLWPILIRIFSTISTIDLHRSAIILSSVIGLIALFIGTNTINRLSIDNRLSLALSSLYVLSPMTVFFFVGYTEALFSLESWILLAIIINLTFRHSCKMHDYILLFSICIAIGLTRASILQVTFSTLGSLALIAIKSKLDKNTQSDFSRYIKISLIMVTGCCVGYLLFGFFCLRENMGFFTPFSVQEEWGKSLGFRPMFLLNTRSPIIDLWGLYYPLIILTPYFTDFSLSKIRFRFLPQVLYQNLPLTLLLPPLGILSSIFSNLLNRRYKPRQDSDLVNDIYFKDLEFLFLYCSLFALSHALICFLTQEQYLYSAGRYIFGQPYFYVALTILVNSKLKVFIKNPKSTFIVSLSISVIYLLKNLIDFGNSKLLL